MDSIKKIMINKSGYFTPILINLLNQRSTLNKMVISKMIFNNSMEKQKIISSLIHMSMNRLFVSQGRKHELLICNFLKRYYHSFDVLSRKNAEKFNI